MTHLHYTKEKNSLFLTIHLVQCCSLRCSAYLLEKSNKFAHEVPKYPARQRVEGCSERHAAQQENNISGSQVSWGIKYIWNEWSVSFDKKVWEKWMCNVRWHCSYYCYLQGLQGFCRCLKYCEVKNNGGYVRWKCSELNKALTATLKKSIWDTVDALTLFSSMHRLIF